MKTLNVCSVSESVNLWQLMNRATCCGGIKKTTVCGGIRNPAIFSVFKPRAPRLRRTKIKPRYRWEEPRFLKIHYVRTEFYFHVLGCGVFSENSSGGIWQLRGVVPGSQLWDNLVSAVEGVGRINFQISVKVFVRPVAVGKIRAFYEKILSRFQAILKKGFDLY